MSKCTHNVRTKIIEYPEQAYLLIESKCRAKSKAAKSLSCSKENHTNSLYKSKLANPQKLCNHHQKKQQHY